MTQDGNSPGFAVLDFETNGLGPWDDILEIGVVLLDSSYNFEGEFGTLVNSGKRVKNAWAHGIDRAQLEAAPAEPIAFRYLLHLLAGRYVVAHNAYFEKRFLDYHGATLGLAAPDTEGVKLIDTMPLAQELFKVRKLTLVGELMELPHRAHTALSDAQVTALLLAEAGKRSSGKLSEQLSKATIWPKRFRSAMELAPQPRLLPEEIAVERGAWLYDLPYSSHPAAEASRDTYRRLVERYSLNFELSVEERESLTTAVADLSLDATSVQQVHSEVVALMASLRFPADFVEQRPFLLTVLADQLGVKLSEETLHTNGTERHPLLKPGCCVMLSGKLSERQDVLTKRLIWKELTPTRELAEAEVVVIGYPDTANQQIRDARSLQKAVLAERSFWILLP